MDASQIEKMKALALAAPKDWYGIYQIADGVTDNDAAALMKACSPAAVLELIAEVERLRSDFKIMAKELIDANLALKGLGTAPAAGTEKDAERYRWLREQRGVDGDLPVDGDVWVVQFSQPHGTMPELQCAGFGDKLDRSIDAAIAAHSKAGK